MNFCVYLTIYRGNKLPPFYIGYTSLNNYKSGYFGTVSSKEYKDVWKSELQNNLQHFKCILLKTFETKEDAKEYETYIQRFQKVHKNPLFMNKCINGEKFFCTGHSAETIQKISGKNNHAYGKPRPQYVKDKISKATKGANNPNFGKKASTETRRKQSIARHGKPASWTSDPVSRIKIGEKISKARKIKNAGAVAREKTYLITFTDKTYIIIRNLTKFSIENNYTISALYLLMNKKRNIHKNIIKIEVLS
jgi:hypothetical protein